MPPDRTEADSMFIIALETLCANTLAVELDTKHTPNYKTDFKPTALRVAHSIHYAPQVLLHESS